MKVGLAQVASRVGDLEANVAACVDAVADAAAGGAELVVLPELVVPGYPPRDILCDVSFVAAVADANADLVARTAHGPPVIFGSIVASGRATPGHPGLFNAALVAAEGRIVARVAKRLLPAYDVFHEPRWFVPGDVGEPVAMAGRRVGIVICEDLWDEGYDTHPPGALIAAGADCLVALSASPYRRGVLARRRAHAARQGRPVIYVNAAGATDELIFDGRSFVTDAAGRLIASLDGFRRQVAVVDIDDATPVDEPDDGEEVLYAALVSGIQEFAAGNRLSHAVIGLSGGVDSSLVACLAADALGPERVSGVAIPSRYTDPRSTEAAAELARKLGIGFETVPLDPLHVAAESALGEWLDAGVAAENLQARLRMTILMTLVNRRGGLLLNTSNKTELSLGYGTLYGDLAGSLCPLGDVTKLGVYALARLRGGMPEFVLERPPTAELRPGQVDPFDYEEVAPRLEAMVAGDRSDAALRASEHKRWQAGVVLKVSERSFGSGRLIPITRR